MPPFYTGEEHSQVYAYYASEDEALCDVQPELDAVAFEDWKNNEIEE